MSAQPTDPHIGLVVEGAGDRNALPVILRSHLQADGDFRDVLGKPVPLHGRNKAFVPNGIEGYVAVAAARPGCTGVLVVLDGEGDCVAARGSDLHSRAGKVVGVPVVVALADRDFEDWLYASAETLDVGLEDYQDGRRGQVMIREALKPNAYTKPVWQPRLAARMDPNRVRLRNVSFNRLLNRFDELRASLPPAP